MKNFYWLLLFQLIASGSYSQKFEPVNPRTDKKEFQGYIIRLLPGLGNSYGYDIIKGKVLIAHQSHNPFTTSPIGLSRKEDVYKIAEWQIAQYEMDRKLSAKNFTGSAPQLPETNSNLIFYKPVPVAVANKLQIKIHR